MEFNVGLKFNVVEIIFGKTIVNINKEPDRVASVVGVDPKSPLAAKDVDLLLVKVDSKLSSQVSVAESVPADGRGPYH